MKSLQNMCASFVAHELNASYRPVVKTLIRMKEKSCSDRLC